ncbi:hypothetical protein GGC63_000688 [Paenibacillus sp. OAS669]|nr:hypothetical protein [Paenibacillus sp. OAS669]
MTPLAVEFNAVLVRSAPCARTEPLSGVRSPSENKKNATTLSVVTPGGMFESFI